MLGDGKLVAVFSFGLASFTITMVNKVIFHTYEFPFPTFLMMGQVLFSFVILSILGATNVVERERITWKRIVYLAPLTILFIATVIFGMLSLEFLTVPMFTILRRAGVLFVVPLQFLIYGKKESIRIVIILTVLAVGTAFAGFRDFYFTTSGYISVLFCNITSAINVLLIEKLKSNGISSSQFLYFVNATSLPLLFLLSLYTGEFTAALSSPVWQEYAFVLCFVLSASQGLLYNFTSYQCITKTSALTTGMVGEMRNVVVSLIGMVLFGGKPRNMESVFAFVLTGVCGFLYTFEKNRMSSKSVNSK